MVESFLSIFKNHYLIKILFLTNNFQMEIIRLNNNSVMIKYNIYSKICKDKKV